MIGDKEHRRRSFEHNNNPESTRDTVIDLKVDEEQWRATMIFWYTTH